MAPIDFEKELQERMRSRERKPSPDTWERIEARLEKEGPVAKNKPGLWIGLAAASVIFLLGFLLLREAPEEFPSIETVVESPEVDTPVEDPVRTAGDRLLDVSDRKDTELAEVETNRPTRDVSSEQAPAVSVYDKQPEVTEMMDPGDSSERELLVTLEPLKDTQAVSQKEVTPSEQESERVREEEIEALLGRASRAIALQKRKDSLGKVDAMALLDRAEDELDQTFREKIMTKLKSGVDKFKTAVADRKK